METGTIYKRVSCTWTPTASRPGVLPTHTRARAHTGHSAASGTNAAVWRAYADRYRGIVYCLCARAWVDRPTDRPTDRLSRQSSRAAFFSVRYNRALWNSILSREFTVIIRSNTARRRVRGRTGSQSHRIFYDRVILQYFVMLPPVRCFVTAISCVCVFTARTFRINSINVVASSTSLTRPTTNSRRRAAVEALRGFVNETKSLNNSICATRSLAIFCDPKRFLPRGYLFIRLFKPETNKTGNASDKWRQIPRHVRTVITSKRLWRTGIVINSRKSG